MDAEHTITNVPQLTARIRQALRSNVKQLQFRYSAGTQLREDLRKAVAGLNEPAGYSASFEPYGTDGSMLVTLELKKG
ncbi:hypothetical protein [Paenibacillus protaetiae]|uniref:Uncharacterized protein n=1 Tax=Paenibacillus protaetiae TaxID=2509456 RepID=A0A4P6F4L8_9BACL|nr:hypothetical protein [Paenibacillus protaetiae]QAY68127.1 hypothetical protein ET464_18870 [Paenibacillus protaetiae]